MSLKKCDKCGEDVDAAKAFCPECGNPFVHEEKRTEATEFEKQAGTVAYSKTMFNMMLSKMDLDTSRSPEEEKQTREHRPAEPPEKRSPPEMPAGREKKSGMIKWIILAALGAVILFLVLIAVLAVLYVYFYRPF